MAREAPEKKPSKLSLVALLPNLVTVTAICAGLTAIRMGIEQRYETAVLLVLLAALLDGLDGRLARLLRSESGMGAELDSLGDFLNFGVAPPVVLFFWVLRDMPGAGWIAVLIFTVCCALRLARFNLSIRSAEACDGPAAYFVGVPAPAAGLLVLLPMMVSFAWADEPLLPAPAVAAYIVIVGLMMISRLPTPSFKDVHIDRANARFYILGCAALGAAVLTYVWVSLVALCAAYVAVLLWFALRSILPRGGG